MLTSETIERVKRATVKHTRDDVLTLGEIIALCEAAIEIEKPKKDIRFDFGYIVPTTFGSYRGYYNMLALAWKAGEGYGDNPKDVLLTDFLALAKQELGAQHEGWKGGEYIMGENTPVWVAFQGECPGCAVVGILDLGYSVIIQTAHCEV